MGVNIFILDRRPTKLAVAGVEQNVGSLRRFWKITELDEERADELAKSEMAVSAMPSPKAAMVADVVEIPLGSKSGVEVQAHPVIGWDEGRTSVTDMGWDYLPVLGYAVRDPDSGIFTLHEYRDDSLHWLGRDRAAEIGLIASDGQLMRRGQPVIRDCRSVRLVITGYAEADCTFDNGRQEMVWINVAEGSLPEPSWFVGKSPREVKKYPPGQSPAPPTPGVISPRP
jgi:hypothetical protein